MNNINFEEIRDFLFLALLKNANDLDPEAVKSIKHFIEYDEYEMAFEGLFIELMNNKVKPKFDYVKSIDIGKQLRLNEESIFDKYFWDKFEKYLSNIDVS